MRETKRIIMIHSVDDESICFDDYSRITFDHQRDCCEHNYADFSQLEDEAFDYEFTLPLEFEVVEGSGFRFGDKKRKFFVPCYSAQNGWYTSELDIYYIVAHINRCEMIDEE